MDNGVRQDLILPAHLMASLALLFLFFMGAASLTSKPVTLTVYPRISSAPATLRLSLHIPRDAENRGVSVVADGTDFLRTTEIELEGTDAATVIPFTWYGVPAGNYAVTARLRGTHGFVSSDRVEIIVQ